MVCLKSNNRGFCGWIYTSYYGFKYLLYNYNIICWNLFGSILLGIISITGPRTGLPQMSAGKRAFGKKFGNFLSSLQWLNTIGWTTVNLVLAAFAFTLLFHVYSVISILILTAAIFLLSYAGHHVIAVFEKLWA